MISPIYSCYLRKCSDAAYQAPLPKEQGHTYSFEQKIAAKVHSDLVLRKSHPLRPIPSACPPTERSTPTARVPSLRMSVASELAKTDLGLTLPSALVDNDVIVKGKKHKLDILTEYEDKYGANHPHSIITKTKGKLSCKPDIVNPTACRPPSRNTIGSRS